MRLTELLDRRPAAPNIFFAVPLVKRGLFFPSKIRLPRNTNTFPLPETQELRKITDVSRVFEGNTVTMSFNAMPTVLPHGVWLLSEQAKKMRCAPIYRSIDNWKPPLPGRGAATSSILSFRRRGCQQLLAQFSFDSTRGCSPETRRDVLLPSFNVFCSGPRWRLSLTNLFVFLHEVVHDV